MSHTPGPWDVKQPVKRTWTPSFALSVVCARAHCLVDGKVPEAPIADIHTLSFADIQEAQANARLIAAAPDLLVACRAFLDADGGDEYTDAEQAAFVLMRDAITKATGVE